MGFFTKTHAGSLTWESIKSKGTGHKPETCSRAKVVGGWFVTTQIGLSGTFMFYPDPNHEWTLDTII